MPDHRFEDFYTFEYPKLVVALRFVTGDQELAQDSVDEACARALERLGRGASIDVLPAWICVVALNVARGRIRRLASERRVRARLVAQASDPEVADGSSAIDVRAALATLSRRQREIVVMHYFLDQTVESIASELAIPAGTVKATLHRARAVLAQSLKETTTPHARERT